MLTPRSGLARRVQAVFDASPSRIPVLVGGSGSGRTALLQGLGDRLGRTTTMYLDVERTASTPERFLHAFRGVWPFPPVDRPAPGTRAAFDQTLALFERARTSTGQPVTFLLDEFLELRTFESFPGLRRVLHDLMECLSASGNRFLLTSRYAARTQRLLRDRSTRFDLIPIPPLTAEDTIDILGRAGGIDPGGDAHETEYVARTVHALAEGHPSYTRALAEELAATRHGGAHDGDPISALAALMSPGGRLAMECAFCYELRLHRARGYGALKAILGILADADGLTLTEISQRLERTPGSTKDYLSWLEDVDLVAVRHKRYSFTDSLLRVWVRLHCRGSAPTEADLAHEIHQYALPRLPHQASTMAMVSAGGGTREEEKKGWGIIEID